MRDREQDQVHKRRKLEIHAKLVILVIVVFTGDFFVGWWFWGHNPSVQRICSQVIAVISSEKNEKRRTGKDHKHHTHQKHDMAGRCPTYPTWPGGCFNSRCASCKDSRPRLERWIFGSRKQHIQRITQIIGFKSIATRVQCAHWVSQVSQNESKWLCVLFISVYRG